MQDITGPLGATAQLIQSYGKSGFRIGNADYVTSVLVLPNATVAWSGELTLDALDPLLAANPKPEILLLGTGARHEMLPKEFKLAIKEKGVVIDSMDTGAACRTFNVLMAEGRLVAAVLTKL